MIWATSWENLLLLFFLLNLCEQQKQRSVGTSLQSDHRLYCSLSKSKMSTLLRMMRMHFLIKKSILAGFSSCVTCEGFWLQNSEDMFFHGKAHRYIITKDLLKKYVSSIPIEKLHAHLWKELLLTGHLTKKIRLLFDDDWRIIWISSHVVNVGTTYNEYPQVLFLCRKEQNKSPNFSI